MNNLNPTKTGEKGDYNIYTVVAPNSYITLYEDKKTGATYIEINSLLALYGFRTFEEFEQSKDGASLFERYKEAHPTEENIDFYSLLK